MPSGAGRALGSTRGTVADKDGRFAIDDLIPGRYHVEVAHGGTEPLRSDEFVLAPGERRDVGKLALRPGFPVAGRVIDESGGPIDGARVVVGGVGATAASAGLFALTDAGGHFSLALPAASYRLSASAAGRGTNQVAVDVTPGSSPPALEIELVRAEARLEGLIRDDGGRRWGGRASRLAGGDVRAGGHAGRLAHRQRSRRRRRPLHDCAASRGRPAPGDPAPRLPAQHSPRDAGQIREPDGSVSRRHRGRGEGEDDRRRGRARATEAIGPGGAKASADVKRDGTFRLLRLVPGRRRLTVVSTGFRSAEQELEVLRARTWAKPLSAICASSSRGLRASGGPRPFGPSASRPSGPRPSAPPAPRPKRTPPPSRARDLRYARSRALPFIGRCSPRVVFPGAHAAVRN